MKAHGPIADPCTILLVISIACEQTQLALVDCDLLEAGCRGLQSVGD